MAPAFSHFDEPYAWLIRGLIEYGWPDISRPGSPIPAHCIGGIQLADLVRSGGSGGLLMEIPAQAGGEPCIEDGRYEFRAHLTRESGRLVFVLRCPEANYFQEFVFDPENPVWTAGYIHQALTEYVPNFVQWRLRGGEISWAQRAGIPEVQADPASQLLVSFVRERVNRHLAFDLGPSEEWWPLGGGGTEHWQGGAIARAGAGIGEPLMRKGKQGARLTTRDELRIRREALRILDLPGTVLIWLSATHLLGGTIWFGNAIYALFAGDELGDVSFAITVSLFLGILSYGLGTASLLGGKHYKHLRKRKLVWLCLGFIASMPLIYLLLAIWLGGWVVMTFPIWLGGGLVVSIWALRIWKQPLVVQALELEGLSG